MVCPRRTTAAITVSVWVAAFAPFAVNAPVPVTVMVTEPAVVSLKKKVAVFEPPGMFKFEPVTAVVHVLLVKKEAPADGLAEGVSVSVALTLAVLPAVSRDSIVSAVEHTPELTVTGALVKTNFDAGAEIRSVPVV